LLFGLLGIIALVFNIIDVLNIVNHFLQNLCGCAANLVTRELWNIVIPKRTGHPSEPDTSKHTKNQDIDMLIS
jgi:hypothetical protein